MTKLVNRAKMTTATTGTGTITLGSAVDGYQTFTNAGVVNSDVVRYVIEDGDAWEIGLGTYSAGTLTRGSIESSNADAALNLTGNAVVFVSAAAADLQELVDFADNFVLPTADGSTGQVLTTNGAGTLTFSTITGYTDADVDTHLNTGTASSGEVLSWTGSDYDWIAVSGGATDIDGLSDGYYDGSSVGLGSGALASDDGGNQNTAVGYRAAYSLTTGVRNVVVGRNASYFGNPQDSVHVGVNAAISSSSATLGSVAIGYYAGANDQGDYNIGLGYYGLQGDNTSKITGNNNVGIGYQTGYDLSTGANNFLGGYQAGTNLTTGSNNVAIGNGALDAATTGGRNIAIGQDAMGLGVATTASGDNVAIGYLAAKAITTGIGNVAIGLRALDVNTGGQDNIAIGRDAVGNNTSAEGLIGLGFEALKDSTAGYNIGIGYTAARAITSGQNNTVIGRAAANTGTNNLTTGSNNTLIGYNAAASSATVSNEITLGNSSITTLRCQVTTITSLSDARDKTDIQPLNAGLEFVEALNPVSFTWNMRDGGKVGVADTGFIAQDLQAAQANTGVTIPDLVYDVNPDKLEAGYGKLIPVLVQAIKDLSEKVKDLEAKLEAK